MSSSLELSSLVDFLSVFHSSRLQCSTACARRSHSPQPPPAPCPLIFSSPACTILLCDHWGDPARHPVLKTACHRRGRLTEIRPLIRSSDWGGVGGGGFLAGKDRQTSEAPKPTAIRHTSAIRDQLSVPGMAMRSVPPCQCHSLSPTLYSRAATPTVGLWRYWWR